MHLSRVFISLATRQNLFISKMHNVHETQKNVSQQTECLLSFATSIFAMLVDFALEFWYKP